MLLLLPNQANRANMLQKKVALCKKQKILLADYRDHAIERELWKN